MAIDLNMDMGSIIKGLMQKKGSGAAMGGNGDIAAKLLPFRNALIFLAATGLLFASYMKLYYQPMKESNLKKTAEIARLNDLKTKTADLEKNIASLKVKLTESKEHYLESLSHFGNSEDLGALYQSVSTLAAKYYLVVLNIKEVPLKAAPVAAAPAPAKKEPAKDGAKDAKPAPATATAMAAAKPAEKPKTTEVKEVQVGVELKGKYSDYIKFKEDLAVAEMLLKVNSENIKVKNDKDEPGNIYVTLNLSTYAIDKKPFENAIGDESK